MSNIIKIPIFPLNTILFPGMTLPLKIFENRYKTMITDCINNHSLFGICLIKEGDEVGGSAEFFGVGTIAKIDKILELKLSVEDYLNSINLFENEWFNKINIPENTNSLIYFVLSRLQSDFFDLQIVLEQLSGQSRVEKLIKLLNKETRANQLRFVDEFIGNKSILN